MIKKLMKSLRTVMLYTAITLGGFLTTSCATMPKNIPRIPQGEKIKIIGSSDPLEKRVKLQFDSGGYSLSGNISTNKRIKEAQLDLSKEVGDTTISGGVYGKVLVRDEKEKEGRGMAKIGIKYKSGKKLRNEIEAKTGVLLTAGEKYNHKQFLFGINDELSFPIYKSEKTDLKTTLKGDIIFSSGDNDLLIDSGAFSSELIHNLQISDRLKWFNRFNYNTLYLNPEKYFFLDKAEKKKAMIGLEMILKNIKVIPSISLEEIKDDETLSRMGFGLDIKTPSWLIQVYVEKDSDNTEQYLLSLGRKIKKSMFEVFYNREEFFGARRDIVGIRFSLPLDKAKVGVDNFEDFRPRNGIYASSGSLDYGLPFRENTMRLNMLRKINEFSNNLDYTEGSYPIRTPTQVYESREGDCDEKANWFSYSAVQHGYKAYVVDYWIGGEGHGVSLVEDKRGNIFINEYGHFYKIDVSPNASTEEKIKAALNQSFDYLSISPKKGESVTFRLYDPSQGNYLDKPPIIRRDMLANPTKPKMESGVRALVRDNF